MTTMEIALLVVGVIIFVISFLMPDIPEKKTQKDIAAEKEEVKRLVEQEVDSMKLRVHEATNDSVEYAVDKAERSLEKVSNEKIMAVNEYAGTILEEINKNHQEVMFLYDMLRDKQEDLTNTVRKADAAVKEMEVRTINAQEQQIDVQQRLNAAAIEASVKQSVSEQSVKPVRTEKIEADENEDRKIDNKKSESDKSKNTQTKSLLQTRNLMQSKIEADLLGTDAKDKKTDAVDEQPKKSESVKEKVVYDILSGGAYKEGSLVNVESPAKGELTTADFQALSNNASGTNSTNSTSSTNSNEKILALYRQGFDTVSIAKSLGLGVGEVKLVIDLFQ